MTRFRSGRAAGGTRRPGARIRTNSSAGADQTSSRLFPALYRGRQMAAWPGGVDELVRGVPGRHDVDLRQPAPETSTWRARAEHYSLPHRRAPARYQRPRLGFLFWSTWKRWFDQTGNEAIEARVIQAGRTMGLRFNEAGQVPTLVCGSGELLHRHHDERRHHLSRRKQDQRSGSAARKAREHCLTTRRYLVRGDGSTAHEGIFDVQTGEFLRQATHQGWRDDSSWARGQAWALYGFGTAYWLSGDERFLDTAQRCADFYIERTPPHGVPPNDWEEPSPQSALRKLGRGHRRQRPPAARRADARPGAGGAIQRLCAEPSSTRS